MSGLETSGMTRCPLCRVYYNSTVGSHFCFGGTAAGHATFTPDTIDYDRIRKMIREEIATALAEMEKRP